MKHQRIPVPQLQPQYTALNVSKYGPEITPYLDTFHAVITSSF